MFGQLVCHQLTGLIEFPMFPLSIGYCNFHDFQQSGDDIKLQKSQFTRGMG